MDAAFVARRLGEIRTEMKAMAHRARGRAFGYAIFSVEFVFIACFVATIPALFAISCAFALIAALMGANEQQFANEIEDEFGVLDG